MTPTPRHDDPGPRRQPQRRNAHNPGTRHRRWARGPTRSSPAQPLPRPTRRTTLWPCGDAEPLPGTALLAGWLARTIITAVTGYTSPGQRVLLYAPPPRSQRRRLDARGAAEGGRDPFAGLHEAAWTVARLGRSIDTATATATPPPPPNDGAADPPGTRGSEPRPRPAEPEPDTPAGHGPRENRDRDGAATTTDPRGFDLIITAVRPQSIGWVHDTDWPRLLTPHGTLAVITHSDHVTGRLVDRIHTLVTTFRNHGMGWLDHIIVLTAPPETAVHADPSINRHTDCGARGHRPVHFDVLLFATDAPAASGGPLPAGRSRA